MPVKRLVAVCDTLIALALVAWVGGHASLGSFAARIVFRDLPRAQAAPTMSAIFSSFDTLMGVMAAIVFAAALARFVALRGVAARADNVVFIAAMFLVATGAFEVAYVHRQIVAMFEAGRTLEPAFASLHKLSERCAHLEVVLTAVILGAQSWGRSRGPRG
jgi:hypothetical protein